MSKKSWIILIAEALVFIFLLGSVSRCSSDKISNLEHNISAYKAQIELVELDNKNLLSVKESLILSESQAREELKMTKSEMSELKKKLGSAVAQISKLETQVGLRDTVHMKSDTVFIEKENITKQFSWSDDWTNINATVFGKSIETSKMTIDKLSIDVPLEVGLTDDYKFFATSENPHVNITDIKSVVVNNSSVKEKEKRWHHGISVGFGFQYGLFGRTFDFGPQFGYSVLYSF